MAEAFPAAFVDKKSGEIKQFDTLLERVEDKIPDIAHYTLLTAKVALLAPFVGGLAVALPVTAGLWWLTGASMKKGIDLMHDKLMAAHKQGEFSEYDLANPEDKKAFERRFGGMHPSFADDFLAMAKLAKLEQTPKLLIIEPYFAPGRSRFDSMISDFMAAATSRTTGKDPVVMLGRGALHDLTPDEMRAVIGHELTHIRLQHMKETSNWLGRFSLNSIINTGLFVAGIAGGLPILPVIGFIAVTNAIGTCLKSIQSRKHEELCDRGAALLTGGTKDLTAALGKIRGAMLKIRQLEANEAARAEGSEPPVLEERHGGIREFIHGTHPTNEKREKLLDRFEKKNPEWCEKQRGFFRDLFNKAAKRRPPAQAAPKPPRPRIVFFRFPKLG